MLQEESIHHQTQNYYGKVLKSNKDLKTNICCTPVNKQGINISPSLKLLHPEVKERYYGCGLVIPSLVEGLTVLDLGCGTGRDAFLLSHLVGEKGKVIGVDMTPEQINFAQSKISYHQEKFQYKKSNVEFKQGKIENLKELNIADNSIDLIVSNCVVNLSPNKKKVLEEALRVLKPGGEFYFSDIYSDRRIPEHLRNDSILYGECLSGALYWNDFYSLCDEVGFYSARIWDVSHATINNPQIEEKIGDIKFFSTTYRLFKHPKMEITCEDFGQSITYNGGIPHFSEKFQLDYFHSYPVGQSVPVCQNTFYLLNESRYSPYFSYTDSQNHLGIFPDCGLKNPATILCSQEKIDEKPEGKIAMSTQCC